MAQVGLVSDHDLLAARRREAVEHTPEARAAAIVARLRAGEVCFCRGGTEEDWWPLCPDCGGLDLATRVELAAYCGDEAARQVSTYPGDRDDHAHLESWARGLARYGQLVQVRAAYVAALQCLDPWEQLHLRQHNASVGHWTCCSGPRGVLEAVKAWIHHPDEERERNWHDSEWTGSMPTWVPGPIRLYGETLPLNVASAGREAGDVVVRTAVQRDLTDWALRHTA